MNLSTSFRKSVVFEALSIVYSYVEQQTRAKKTDALAGDSMCTATLLLAWELQTYFFSSEWHINGSLDWLTK